MTRFFLSTAAGTAVLLALAVSVTSLRAAEPASGEQLVPVEIKLPRPLFVGTPKNIKASATMEKIGRAHV